MLTPSFNQAAWLSDALRSVETQTYERIEHIVMDGGSTDGSVEVLERSGAGVRWATRRDRGQSAALNTAFAESTGSIIGWLNADDAYFHRRVVERVVETLRTHPDVDVVYGHAALINADGLVLHFLWAPHFRLPVFRRVNFICQPTVFVRRSSLEGVFVDEGIDYSMDRELWLRLSRSCRFSRINDVLAADRHHTRRKSYTRIDLWHADLDVLTERYGLPQRSRAFTKAVNVALRLRAGSLVFSHPTDLAFHGTIDGRVSLLRRQLFTPRAMMPVGAAS